MGLADLAERKLLEGDLAERKLLLLGTDTDLANTASGLKDK